jgi:vancomycin resistance protein VanJ
MNDWAHWLLLPALLLLPLAIWRRRWLIALMLGAGAAAFVWAYGPLFLPHSSEDAGGQSFVVMTANVGEMAPDSFARLITVLGGSDADIIGLQELSDLQAAVIESELGELYPHQALLPAPRYAGKGLLSRYPILEADMPFRLDGYTLTHMRAVVDIDGLPVTVISAHLPPRSRNGAALVENPYAADMLAMLIEAATVDGPGILLGDFNFTDQNNQHTRVRSAGLIDAFRAAGWGFGLTAPARFPLVRIDYIWHTGHFQAIKAWVGPYTGADHLPVLAELAWRE